MKVTKQNAFTPISIVLETEQEAIILRSICACVGGSPSGPRGFASKLFEELQRLGVSRFHVGAPIDMPNIMPTDIIRD